jgi:hypothetical protein
VNPTPESRAVFIRRTVAGFIIALGAYRTQYRIRKRLQCWTAHKRNSLEPVATAPDARQLIRKLVMHEVKRQDCRVAAMRECRRALEAEEARVETWLAGRNWGQR